MDPKTAFTEEEIKRLQRLASRTWDYIAGDVLRALEENGEKPEMPRSHVIEVALDADHMEMTAGRSEEDRALLKRFRVLDYKAKQRLVRPAFPFARYGW